MAPSGVQRPVDVFDIGINIVFKIGADNGFHLSSMSHIAHMCVVQLENLDLAGCGPFRCAQHTVAVGAAAAATVDGCQAWCNTARISAIHCCQMCAF